MPLEFLCADRGEEADWSEGGDGARTRRFDFQRSVDLFAFAGFIVLLPASLCAYNAIFGAVFDRFFDMIDRVNSTFPPQHVRDSTPTKNSTDQRRPRHDASGVPLQRAIDGRSQASCPAGDQDSGD